MHEGQQQESSDSLFQLRHGSEANRHSDRQDPLVELLRRSEDKRDRLERQLGSEQSSWDRDRQRLRSEVAELTTEVGRLRDQANKSDELRRSLEESQIYGRQLEIQCEKQATELGTRGGAMKKRIDELEQQIVELLSRAGNDHRRQQAADAHANAELDIHKRKIEIEFEQKLRVSEVHSKKEIRTLEREIERLRKEVVKRPPSLFHRFRAR